MSESAPERTIRESEIAPDLHTVLNCLAAIQCQWFLLKSSLSESQAECESTAAMNRLLEDLSAGMERLQTTIARG
jgi:hypothetical protein